MISIALEHSLPSFDVPLVSLKILEGVEDYSITICQQEGAYESSNYLSFDDFNFQDNCPVPVSPQSKLVKESLKFYNFESGFVSFIFMRET